MNKQRLGIAGEICLIAVISTVLGIAWNRTLLTGAWRGELSPQASSAAAQGAQSPMPIGLAQVKELSDAGQALIVDARSAVFFTRGHIAGAIPLPLEEARRRPAAPFTTRVPTGATIIVYCNGFSCHDSMDLGRLLIAAGYPSVYVYEGGFPEWRDAGYPTKGGAL